ncbi:hypothetical protein NUS47_03185 [Glaesserella parasuis]|nr:hypothetical protein [Glaesserella parasuis]
MTFITQLGKVLLGSHIKPNTGDQHTDKVSHQVYEQGVILLSQGNYKEALNHFKKAASFGHISAKYNLALMLFNGLGDYPDFELARKLFQEAKNSGHTRCDNFLVFMNEVDEIMASGNPNLPPQREIFAKNTELAFTKVILDSEKQAGGLIYLVSRHIFSIIGNNMELAKDFISNELGAMHLGNEVSIQYLKDIGKFDKNIDWESFENNFNEVTQYLDHTIWPSIIRASGHQLEFDDLVYARCCILNEIVNKYA